MKHHSQRSKRPPSRTLAPRILAALAAGAFTLGGMPYALADPIVMSTVTTDTVSSEGVAGSTDGTAATITVGTDGGGASPEIYYLAGSDHRPTLVAGAWRKVSLTDGTIDFTGANAGGAAYTETKDINSTATVTDNEASVTGGSFTAQTLLYGGKVITETHARSEAKALRNKLTFTTGDTVKELYGGYAYARPTNTSISLQANENHLPLKAGAKQFYGGYAFGEQMASGTHVPLSTAEANGNIVTIAADSGTFEKNSAAGYSETRVIRPLPSPLRQMQTNSPSQTTPSRRSSTAARRRRITTMRPVLPRRRYAATSYGRTGARSRGKF